MMAIVKFRIVYIDHYGYCGRDNHPTDRDKGLVVRLVKLDTFFFTPEVTEPVVGKDGRLYVDALPYLSGRLCDDEGLIGLEVCYQCVTDDGRLLDLMDNEVEIA